VGRELAEGRPRVVFVEEGRYFDHDFTGRAFAMQSKLYRRGGSTFSVGTSRSRSRSGRPSWLDER